MENNHEEIAAKYVGQECLLYTLDGVVPAKIRTGTSHAIIDSFSLRILVNWPTVARKMESDKTFYAC